MKDTVRLAEFFNGDLLVRQCVLDACGSVREIGDSDHDRGRGSAFRFPPLTGFVPVVTEDGVGGVNEVWERDVRLHFAVNVVFDVRVGIDVVQTGFEVLSKTRVIADNDTGSLDQSRFDGVVQAEVANDPLE